MVSELRLLTLLDPSVHLVYILNRTFISNIISVAIASQAIWSNQTWRSKGADINGTLHSRNMNIVVMEFETLYFIGREHIIFYWTQ